MPRTIPPACAATTGAQVACASLTRPVVLSRSPKVLKSYVGGDDFWAVCWIMACGVSDLSPAMLSRALEERGSEYSRKAYMLSAQLARRPDPALSG